MNSTRDISHKVLSFLPEKRTEEKTDLAPRDHFVNAAKSYLSFRFGAGF